MRVSSISLIAASLFASVSAHAIEFIHLNGTATSGYTAKGAPTNLFSRSAELPQDVLNNIYSMVPESQYVNRAYIDNSLQSNLIVDKDFKGVMTVTVTFLNEGAGYRNTFGYFIYDPENPPTTFNDIQEHVIVFPNASKAPDGELAQGASVPLNINLVAGQALGFFVIPNGWGWGGSNGSINSLGPWNQPFYTLPTLNPEAAALQAHNVAFYDALNRFFVFGFDDQNRNQGDNDFNDLLVSVVATPSYAVEGINPDGSVDANTYQVLVQSNAEVTSTTYYPSQNDTATLVFEDLWPRMGDYDFNDLVLSYRFTNTLNNRNRLTAMEWNFSLQALGASYHNGLALHLPNVAADNIKSSTLSRNGVVIRTDLLESGHSDAHFVLFDDLKTLVESTCEFFRTLTNCESAVNDTYTLSIVFTNPVDTAAIGQPPYDPYLFATEGGMHGSYSGRGWEVHMKQFSGSALFSTSFYGDLDDRSDGQNHFLNRNNFPWVINIPGTWDHPLEGVDTLRAYPQLKDWVESKGSAHQDWYLKANAVRSNLYGQ